MIQVIPFVFKEDEVHPITFRTLHRAGESVVSHGFCHDTGKHIILPSEPFHRFVTEHCTKIDGDYFLKD